MRPLLESRFNFASAAASICGAASAYIQKFIDKQGNYSYRALASYLLRFEKMAAQII
jgi:hypothetical protein